VQVSTKVIIDYYRKHTSFQLVQKSVTLYELEQPFNILYTLLHYVSYEAQHENWNEEMHAVNDKNTVQGLIELLWNNNRIVCLSTESIEDTDRTISNDFWVSLT